MNIKQTHTFSILELSSVAYEEIKSKLIEAGWGHVIMEEDGKEVIDMNGIAVSKEVIEYAEHRHHCGHHALNLYRDDQGTLRCSVCQALR